MKHLMTGYAAVIIGLTVIMFSLVGLVAGAPAAIAKSKGMMGFGGFIAAWGFITAGCFSKDEPAEVRAGLIIASAITILATIMLI